MKLIFQATIILGIFCACQQITSEKPKNNDLTKFYSKSVNDSFSIFISLPDNYKVNEKNKYPVVYLLDANLYFDIIAATIKRYSEVGLISPTILVGIGYKDLATMDSLRTRDYTFPLAIPEYEMSLSGKADQFLNFLNTELIPSIDANYSVDTTNRILMGHSLGGYFTLFAILENLKGRHSLFKGYIAASPSIHYNHHYLLNQLDKLKETNQNKSMVYVVFGGLEDTEEGQEDTTMLTTDAILLSLSQSLKNNNKINYKGETYSNLGHMDTPLPAFVKGLQWTLNKPD